ncbi:DNA polymerase II [Aurantivibrio plasticivorans]
MNGFLLTRQWRDTPNGIVIELWLTSDDGPCKIEIGRQEAVFFVKTDDLPHIESTLLSRKNSRAGFRFRIGSAALKNFCNEPVTPIYFVQYRQLKQAARLLDSLGLQHWESDVRPAERYLMERFITGGVEVLGEARYMPHYRLFSNPQLRPSDYRPSAKIISLDIETNMTATELYSIAVYGSDVAIVYMIGDKENNRHCIIKGIEFEVRACVDQADCLSQFLSWCEEYDPDIFVGWSVVQFDFWVLESLSKSLRVPLTIGRASQPAHWRSDDETNRRYIQIPGRVALDGIDILKTAFYNFQSFSLNNVAAQLLGESKLLDSNDRGEEITELFANNKQALAEYNIVDCQLVWDIFQQEKLIDFVVERTQLTGLLLDRFGGSVASFDFAYLPLLHRRGYVAPNLGELESDVVSPGGYVMDSRPGIFNNVLVLDFKSLYPSIIRTFNIDPYAYWHAKHNQLQDDDIIPGFNQAYFSKSNYLLPDIIAKLWAARDSAKANANQPLSQAIKIIMNSFYGVLGSTGCRFFDPRVCSSITLRGHEIIRASKEWIEKQGYQVIYGDTDSVFVWIGDEVNAAQATVVGSELAKGLNVFWQDELAARFGITSTLEIEFETHYSKFLMPTIRGSNEGSKKRYAGIIESSGKEQLIFKGLENVRTDWTELAKEFQQSLYRRVFSGEAVEGYVKDVVAQLNRGERDSALIYRKRLRQKLADYQKSTPPHVRAARRLPAADQKALYRGDWVEYVLTVNGPEPVTHVVSQIDYQHYVDKQLAPVADSVLQFIDLSFKDIVAPQLSLFS